MIGLGLLRAAVGKEHAELRAEPVGGEDRVGARAAAEPRAEQRAACLRDEPLAHALGAVAREGVGDLVPEHDREPVGALGEREDAGVDGDLAAGQTERVLLLRIVDRHEAPLVVGTLRDAGQALPHCLDRSVHLRASVEVALAEHLLEGARPELVLLLRRDEDQLRAASVRRGGAACEQGGDCHARAAAEHAPGLAGHSAAGNAGVSYPASAQRR